jgi:hypothetical protein
MFMQKPKNRNKPQKAIAFPSLAVVKPLPLRYTAISKQAANTQ